jgi:hypothetical protein
VRVEVELVADDALDHGPGVLADEAREEFVGAPAAWFQQERFEQRVNLGRRLFHRRRKI